MTLLYETHAESEDNAAGLASGWFDAPLSPKGESQAHALGRRRSEALAAVYCSDLQRAWRTAEIAFAGRGVPIGRDARLRECDYGELTRSPADRIESTRMSHGTVPFRGGESYTDVVVRVSAWLREAAARHPDATVLVIAHRGPYFALEHLLAGSPLREAMAAPWSWQPGWIYSV